MLVWNHVGEPRYAEIAGDMVGIVEEIGSDVTKVTPGDRVTVNVETFLW